MRGNSSAGDAGDLSKSVEAVIGATRIARLTARRQCGSSRAERATLATAEAREDDEGTPRGRPDIGLEIGK